jgi:hypothetical protein
VAEGAVRVEGPQSRPVILAANQMARREGANELRARPVEPASQLGWHPRYTTRPASAAPPVQATPPAPVDTTSPTSPPAQQPDSTLDQPLRGGK